MSMLYCKKCGLLIKQPGGALPWTLKTIYDNNMTADILDLVLFRTSHLNECYFRPSEDFFMEILLKQDSSEFLADLGTV